MHGIIQNGSFYPAPAVLSFGGMIIANPTADQLEAAGYLPVQTADRPEQSGMYAVPHYETQGGIIVQTWTLTPIPPSPEEILTALMAAIEGGLSDG